MEASGWSWCGVGFGSPRGRMKRHKRMRPWEGLFPTKKNMVLGPGTFDRNGPEKGLCLGGWGGLQLEQGQHSS